MKVLHLPLKGKWYRMIRSGEKPEEYREITPYWVKRLIDERLVDRDGAARRWKLKDLPAKWYSEHVQQLIVDLSYGYAAFKPFTDVCFTFGYPKSGDEDRRMCRPIGEMVIGTGRPEWGATPGKMYFVIRIKDE